MVPPAMNHGAYSCDISASGCMIKAQGSQQTPPLAAWTTYLFQFMANHSRSAKVQKLIRRVEILQNENGFIEAQRLIGLLRKLMQQHVNTIEKQKATIQQLKAEPKVKKAMKAMKSMKAK